MNTPTFSVCLAFSLVAGLLPLRANETFEVIPPEELELTDHAIILHVQDGVRRVRLQVRYSSANDWEFYSLAHLDGSEGYVKLRLPDGFLLSNVQLATSTSDPFPYTYYSGKTEFSERTIDNGNVLAPTAAPGENADRSATGGGVEVTESDIWQWRGTTLYFFNQYRGLQVFDVSDAEAPRKQASLRMPAVGEQMYLLNNGYVVLLANRWGADGSELLLIKHDENQLDIAARFPVDGHFVESRMVGSWLYSVSQANRVEQLADGSQYWTNGLQVNAIDLTNPANPVQKGPLTLWDDQGQSWWYSAVVTATANELLIAPFEYRQGVYSTVHLIDIRDPNKPLEISASIPLEGQLLDKFKLRVSDGILTTASMVNRWGQSRVLNTRVDTFDLTNTEVDKHGRSVLAPKHLDSLTLAKDETLFATRFDQERLYVVTFRIIDPLFVVDLTDPRNLRVLGELEIPGYSTYLQPMGDRLLSVGVEDRHVAISLFDVADTGKPALMSRVYLGDKDAYTWSEGNYDEKAVGYLKDQNLLMVPFESYGPEGLQRSFQLIDISEDSLTLRGVIDHQFQPRRATALKNVLVSVSGRELLTLDATDRDAPKPLATLPIAWSVDRVFTLDDHIVQIETGNAWADDSNPVLRVSSMDDTETVLGQLALGKGTVVGMLMQGDYLYLATSSLTYTPFINEDGFEDTRSENHLVTHVISLESPTKPVLLGSAITDLGSNVYGQPQVAGHFADETHLVWTSAASVYYYPWFRGGPAIDVIAHGPALDRRPFPFTASSLLPEFYVIDVANKTSPQQVAHLKSDADNVERGGKSIVVGTNVYFSYSQQDQVTENQGEEEAQSYLSRKHYLIGARFDNPTKPVLTAPINIPGRLEHIYADGNGGTVLFTVSDIIGNEANGWRNDLLIQASIFDDEKAYFVSDVVLPNGLYAALAFNERFFFTPTPWDAKEPGLQVYGWSIDAKFTKLAVLKTGGEIPYQLSVVDHEKLLFSVRSQIIDVIDIQNPERGLPLASYTQPIYASVGNVHVPDRQIAWLPASLYGIETLDLTLLQPLILAQESGAEESQWTIVAIDQKRLTTASGIDFIGSLADTETWRYASLAKPQQYGEWAQRVFNPMNDQDVALAEARSDADGDGFTNVTEFAFGTDPTSNQSIPAVSIQSGCDDAGKSIVTFNYAVNPLAKDVSYTSETSTDLQTWSPVEDAVLVDDQYMVTLRPDEEPMRFVTVGAALE